MYNAACLTHLIKLSPFSIFVLIAYTDQAYKACIIQGGSPGDSYVTGDAYLWKVFSYGTWQLWAPDFIALVAFFLLFTFATAAVMEWGNV